MVVVARRTQLPLLKNRLFNFLLDSVWYHQTESAVATIVQSQSGEICSDCRGRKQKANGQCLELRCVAIQLDSVTPSPNNTAGKLVFNEGIEGSSLVLSARSRSSILTQAGSCKARVTQLPDKDHRGGHLSKQLRCQLPERLTAKQTMSWSPANEVASSTMTRTMTAEPFPLTSISKSKSMTGSAGC